MGPNSGFYNVLYFFGSRLLNSGLFRSRFFHSGLFRSRFLRSAVIKSDSSPGAKFYVGSIRYSLESQSCGPTHQHEFDITSHAGVLT